MDITFQVCNTCKRMLQLNDFHKHSIAVNGHSGKCKACTEIYRKKWIEVRKSDTVWCEHEKIRIREKNRRARGKTRIIDNEAKKRASVGHNKRFPEKVSARNASRVLKKSRETALHHWSYLKQHHLDVISLTIAQHALVHRHTIYDQERMMYRRLDGTLIDSREAAIAYYATLKD